jgi:hypothetical protein
LVCASSRKREAYENVILHVVWEHDSNFRKNNTEIPVLELKNVDAATISIINL